MVLYLYHICHECLLHGVLWSHIGTLMHRLAAEPGSTAGLLFLSPCPSGTILLTPCSMIRWCLTGWFQEQGQCFFIGLSCSIPTIVFYSFSLSLLSVYRLVLWSWGLRTDRVYITLSQPCTADLFLIIIIIITVKNQKRCNVHVQDPCDYNSIGWALITQNILLINIIGNYYKMLCSCVN